MMQIEFAEVGSLVEPPWHATYILRPDMVALASSIGEFGLLSPLTVQKDKNLVIDGSQRLRIIKGNKHIGEKFADGIPITYVDCDELDAMILHIQMNRGRGSVFAKHLSTIIKKLHRSKRLSQDDFERLFSMKFDELEVMLDGTLIKHRNIPNYNYSRAWVPVEAPPNTVEIGSISIERPPNSDR